MPDDDDEDRRAILSRRNRFVAIALSGLAVGSACGDDVQPQVCLSAPPVEMTPLDPQLEMVVPEEEAPEPPPEEETAMVEEEATQMMGMRPRPCLRRPRPTACLNYVTPQVCLSEAIDETPPPPPPQPCLEPPPQVCLTFKPDADDEDPA